MGVHSGKFGALDGIGSVMDWTLNDSMEPSEYTVSGSLAAPVRIAGIEMWDGAYNQLTGEPTYLPGEGGAWKGYTAPDDDVLGNAGVCASGNILVSEAQINWDWEGSEAINSALTFMGDGELSWTNEAITDATVPNPLSICPTKIETSEDGLAWTPVPNLASAQLTLTNNLIEYVNSSTDCQTERGVGTYDWTLALNQQDNIRTGHINKNDIVYVRCYIDATNYWYLAYGLVRDFTNLTVNIETGEIITRTINIDMTASNGTTLGGVIAPSGKQWWNPGHTPPT